MSQDELTKNIKRNMLDIFIPICVILVIVIAATVFYLLTRGTITTTGEDDSKTRDVTLNCKNGDFLYPFYRYDNAVAKNTEVNIIFTAPNNAFRSISLKQTMEYNDSALAEKSDVENSVTMGSIMGDDGLTSDDLSKTFTRLDSTVIMTIFANASNFMYPVNKYFLVNGLNTKSLPKDFQDEYERQGFSCARNE